MGDLRERAIQWCRECLGVGRYDGRDIASAEKHLRAAVKAETKRCASIIADHAARADKLVQAAVEAERGRSDEQLARCQAMWQRDKDAAVEAEREAYLKLDVKPLPDSPPENENDEYWNGFWDGRDALRQAIRARREPFTLTAEDRRMDGELETEIIRLRAENERLRAAIEAEREALVSCIRSTTWSGTEEIVAMIRRRTDNG